MSGVLYVDTSAVLRAALERGLTPDVEERIGRARYLITSRLALVESARALARLRSEGVAESVLADAAGELDSIWSRCTLWELSAAVCELAATLLAAQPLRTLDALHLATYVTARRHFGPDLQLLTTDTRLAEAVRIV